MDEHQTLVDEEELEITERTLAEEARLPLPRPWPISLGASGLYVASSTIRLPQPQPIPLTPLPRPLPTRLDRGPEPEPLTQAMVEEGEIASMEEGALLPWWFESEELRLDIDQHYPQSVVSGTLKRFLSTRVHWIANLRPIGLGKWTGSIWYKDGDTASLPYTTVEVRAYGHLFPTRKRATVTFSGGGMPARVRTYTYKSPYYHQVEFEFDSVIGTDAVTSIDTWAHPNHPADLPRETLTIQKVYRRAGFRVQTSLSGKVPISFAGANQRWSDSEMHDAMQKYWSHFASKAQWSMWVFFAALHEQGTGLGGIMFDDIGPNHRQGTSIFNDSFISNAPSGDPAPDAWVKRMKFWTACHEMGHAFNLAHSWQKDNHPPSWGHPWIPLTNDTEARSFMNYPYSVQGGQTSFFSDFYYRFADDELLFLRHAPERFVQMGNADWFEDHGFNQARVSPEPKLELFVRLNRETPKFEFLEPVVVELKLKNVSRQPMLVEKNQLSMLEHLTVIIKKDGKPARQFSPYAQYCFNSEMVVLSPDRSLYESLFLSVGPNGWELSEPGNYTIQVCLNTDQEDVVSKPLRISVMPPKGYEHEVLAQDYFCDEVGRVLNFDGSLVLKKGNEVLNELIERFDDSAAALHARIALATPKSRAHKELHINGEKSGRTSTWPESAEIIEAKPKTDEARAEFVTALCDNPNESADALGHIDYKWYTDLFTDWLNAEGDKKSAAQFQDNLLKTMKERGVLPEVLEDIERRRDSYHSK